MEVKLNLNVTNWTTPTVVHFDEGLKLPVSAVDKEIIQHLCHEWLVEVSKAAGLEFSLDFFDSSDGKE